MSSFYSFKNIFKKEEKMLVVLITENVLLEKALPLVIKARSKAGEGSEPGRVSSPL